MKNPLSSRLRILGVIVFALSGWVVAWRAHSPMAETSPSVTRTKSAGMREAREKDHPRDARNPSLYVSDSSFSQLLASLSEISASARPGEPNQKLVAACQTALSNPDNQRRFRDFYLLMELMRPEDAAALHRQFLETHHNGLGYTREYDAFATRWGEIDAPGALDFMMSEKPFRMPTHDFQAIARGWGKTDPQAAVDWMKQHPELSQSMGGRYALLDGWFLIDPTRATRWMLSEKMPPGELASCIRGGAWQQLFSTGVVDAAKWLSQLPDDQGEMASANREGWHSIQGQLTQLSYDQASTAWSQVANTSWMSFDDFKNFGNQVSRATANTEGLAGYLNSVATKWPAAQVSQKFEQWAAANPESTAAWLMSSPDSALLKPALEGAIRALEKSNAPEAAEELRGRLK